MADGYVPVVDISQHQGRINFPTMRARGVRGLIIRATHGFTVDLRLQEYVDGARAAGYRDSDLGFYSFCNPKRGPGRPHGAAFVGTVRSVLGHTRTFYMFDAESYVAESGSHPPLYGSGYARWMREFIGGINDAAPDALVMSYTNAAFWNPNVADTTFGEYDLIVARYPFYSLSAPRPPADASQWADWIMSATTKRPQVPRGWDTWDGWQFSAGYNQMGAVYGCESRDLDLNIVTEEAWARWTRPVLPPPDPIPSLPLWVAATGGSMLRFVGSKDNDDGTRWVSNGQVRTNTTFEAANYLIAHKLITNLLDTADMLTQAELDGLPLVG